MYMLMGFSVSSDCKKSSCATIRLEYSSEICMRRRDIHAHEHTVGLSGVCTIECTLIESMGTFCSGYRQRNCTSVTVLYPYNSLLERELGGCMRYLVRLHWRDFVIYVRCCVSDVPAPLDRWYVPSATLRRCHTLSHLYPVQSMPSRPQNGDLRLSVCVSCTFSDQLIQSDSTRST